MSKTVAIAGINGFLGKDFIEAFTSSPFKEHYNLPIRVLTRNIEGKTSTDAVKYYKVDPDSESAEADLETALKGVNVFIDLLPPIAKHKLYIDASAKAGVEVFFPSEFGTYIAETGEFSTIFQLKIDAAKYARSKGLKTVQVVTGFFLTDLFVFQNPVVWGIDPKTNKAVVFGSGEDRISVTALPDIAKSVASIAYKSPSELPDLVKIYSDVVTNNQVIKQYEEKKGEKIETTYKSIEEVRKLASDTLATFNPAKDFGTIIRAATVIYPKSNNFEDKNEREFVNPNGKVFEWTTLAKL